MNELIAKILEDYHAGIKTLEETNYALKAAGANFHLDPGKNPEGGWTEAEMTEGFTPGDPDAVKLKDLDMSRCEALAGKTVIQETKAGRYSVRYNEEGYAIRASRL